MICLNGIFRGYLNLEVERTFLFAGEIIIFSCHVYIIVVHGHVFAMTPHPFGDNSA